MLVEYSATRLGLVFHAACWYSLISPASLVLRWIRAARVEKAMTNATYSRWNVIAQSTWKKSVASSVPAWARRKVSQDSSR